MPDEISCGESNRSPTWGLVDLFAWKLLPQRYGGGASYIRAFKDAWVQHNKAFIKAAASRGRMPPQLLAGVCWIEVGGDPNFIDRVAFEVRAFDWSGPSWVDRNLTITSKPGKTSFGSVSIQLGVAAQTLGLDPTQMTPAQLLKLGTCLQQDVFNIDIVARHLRQLIDHDGLQTQTSDLTMDQVRVVGARYNRGVDLSIDQIKKDTSYGDFIVNHWAEFTKLLL